jgi:hypothetical protein
MRIVKSRSIRRLLGRREIEWLVGALITVAAVYLHWVNFRSAGALWRDEAGVGSLAILPTVHDMWSNLGHESCPIAFPMLLRGWSFTVGSSDAALRVLGLVVGVLMLTMMWFSGWFFQRSAPVLALSLLALNASVVRWGDSLRAYGLGSVLILIALLTVWRFIQAPNLRRWLGAAAAAVISVQCLFQNAFLLLAACAAAAVLSARRRDFKNALAALAVGVPAAVSLLPYWIILREAQDWSVLSQIGFIPQLIGSSLSAAVAPTFPSLAWLWIGLGLLAVAASVKSFYVLPQTRETAGNARAVFVGTALLAGLVTFSFFLWVARMPTQVWYFLPLITFGAVCIDAALASWPRRWPFWRVAVPALALACFPGAYRSVADRQSNMDLVAALLRERADAQDLIVVHPWSFGISFDRQYSGPAHWTTVPPLADHRFHRYDLFKQKMVLENPAQPVCDEIAATLRAGNRVWLVGDIPVSQIPPPQIQPAPNNPWGWLDDAYSDVWGAQIGYFVALHATQGEVIPTSAPNPVSPLENVQVIAVAGWQEVVGISATAGKHR